MLSDWTVAAKCCVSCPSHFCADLPGNLIKQKTDNFVPKFYPVVLNGHIVKVSHKNVCCNCMDYFKFKKVR